MQDVPLIKTMDKPPNSCKKPLKEALLNTKTDELEFELVPLKRVGIVHTEFIYRGKLEPLPFSFDDE